MPIHRLIKCNNFDTISSFSILYTVINNENETETRNSTIIETQANFKFTVWNKQSKF